MIWSDTPPEDCPFPRSEHWRGLGFTGRYRNYSSADTWYPAWASDGSLYSPWTDGSFGPDLTFPHDCSSQTGNDANRDHPGLAGTGHARISGDDPMALTLENLGIDYASSAPYGGRYPSASLIHEDIWYYGTYCVDETGRTDEKGRPYNWDVLGPFVGFRISRDHGHSWEPCPHSPETPLFGESGKGGSKVRLGVPHFVDFGQNMRQSPDGHAYLVGHGTDNPRSRAAWICGDGAWLARARPDPHRPEWLNDPKAWTFFSGFSGPDDRGEAVWVAEVSASKPLIHWPGRIGHVTATWIPGLSRFLMCVTDGRDTISAFNSYILEAPSITGPWSLVTWMEKFGEQGYFLNFPSKFVSRSGTKAWLAFSANFTNHHLGLAHEDRPTGAKYALSLHETYLVSRDEKPRA